MNSKVNTWLLGILLTVAGVSLKFWRDVAIDQAMVQKDLRQLVVTQDSTSALAAELRVRQSKFEVETNQKFVELNYELLRLKLAVGK